MSPGESGAVKKFWTPLSLSSEKFCEHPRCVVYCGDAAENLDFMTLGRTFSTNLLMSDLQTKKLVSSFTINRGELPEAFSAVEESLTLFIMISSFTYLSNILTRCRTLLVAVIYYRCADGRFLMSPRGLLAVSNTRYLSSSETSVYAGIREWELHLFEPILCQESVGGICFTNK
jgi:hypothetical protein